MNRFAKIRCGFALATPVWVCALLAAAPACNAGREDTEPPVQVAQTPTPATEKPAEKPAEKPQEKNPLLAPTDPAVNQKAPDFFKVKFTTTKGDFVVEVDREWAPKGADRFYNLVNAGFYDGCRFFRVISGFMAQFGVSGDPKVTSVWNKARLQDDPVKASNKRGFVSFAMAGPNSRTTQVFINFIDGNSRLDSMGFAPFGKVSQGMEVVDKIYSGYGEVPQEAHAGVQTEGNAYLDKNYPKVDSIKTARVIK